MFSWIRDFVDSAGYLGLGVLMALENVFPPIPSELIMPLGGYFAAEGRLSLIGVILVGTLGSVLGTMPLYYLGVWLSRERLCDWTRKHGKWLMIKEKDVNKSLKWFDRHSKTTVLLARMVPGLRSVISIPAGAVQMDLRLYLALTTIGALGWCSLLTYLGSMLGKNFKEVDRYIGPITYVVVGGMLAWYVVFVIRRKSEERHEAAGA